MVAGVREGRYRLLYVSPERLVGEGERRLPVAAGARCASASSPSTKRTASASGDTTSGRNTASSARLRELLPGISVHAYTATATARVRRDIAAQLGLRRAARARRRVRPAEPPLPRAAAGTLKRQLLDVLGAPSQRSRHHLLHVAPRGRRAGGLADTRSASRRCPITPDSRDAERSAKPGRVPQRARRHHRGHRRVRHGHRSVERAVRRPRRRAAVARALPAGIRPRGPRRTRGRVPPDLLGRRLHAVAGDARAERRADRREPRRCCGRWSATPPASAAAIVTSSEYFGDRYAASSLRRLRLLPRRARARRRRLSSWRARSCRAWRGSASGSAPRTWRACCAGTRASRSCRAGHDRLSTFGLLAGRFGRRDARLHRAADRRWACCGRPMRNTRCWC